MLVSIVQVERKSRCRPFSRETGIAHTLGISRQRRRNLRGFVCPRPEPRTVIVGDRTQQLRRKDNRSAGMGSIAFFLESQGAVLHREPPAERSNHVSKTELLLV